MLGLWAPLPFWRRTPPAPALPAAEAVQLTSDNAAAVVAWLTYRGADVCATTASARIDVIDLDTGRRVTARPGNWVVHHHGAFAVVVERDGVWVRGLRAVTVTARR